MAAPSLREIEKALYSLWTDRKARDIAFPAAGSSKKKAASSLAESISGELLAQIDRRGVSIYADLLNIGHQDLMENVFPGCARLIGDKWSDEVDNYFVKFPPDHFNFNRAAERFSEYLSKFGDRYVRKYPFIVELADYEWLELELLENPGRVEKFPHEQLVSPEQFESLRPVVNPVLAIRRYKYPVTGIVEHLEGDCCLPRDVAPKPCCVVVYRDPVTHDCRFLEVGEITARVVEAALESPTSYKDLIALVVSTSGGMDAQQCVLEFLQMVETLQEVNLFVGSVAVR